MRTIVFAAALAASPAFADEAKPPYYDMTGACVNRYCQDVIQNAYDIAASIWPLLTPAHRAECAAKGAKAASDSPRYAIYQVIQGCASARLSDQERTAPIQSFRY